MNTSRIPAAMIFAAGLALSAPASAALNAYMKIDGVPGDSMDSKHMGWIEVSSPQLDEIRSSLAIGSATGGAGAGKVKFNEFTIKKTTDKASPVFLKASTRGTHFPVVVIEMRKAGGGQQEYLVIKLENVLVSSYRAGGQGAEGPEESISLSFAKATLQEPPVANIPATITKVTPSDAAANTGQVLTFAVEGTGGCVRSRIDFGDGSVVEFPFANGKSQPAPTHAYSKVGSFEVRAYGLADPWAKLPAPPPSSEHVCSGHAFANVTIRSFSVAPAVAPAVRK